MTTNEYPNLKEILSTYFHQDFIDHFGGEEEATQACLEDEPWEVIRQANVEILALLDSHLDGKQLDEFMLTELGCYYYPEASGRTQKQWLQYLRRRLTHGMEAAHSGSMPARH